MTEEELKAFAVSHSLTRWKRLYDWKRNPLYVWEARTFCRATKVALPEWIEQYLDETSARLLAIDPPPNEKNLAGCVAEAVGLHTTGGASHFKQLNTLKLHEEAVNLVGNLRERRDKAKDRDPKRRKPTLEKFKSLQVHGKIRPGAHSSLSDFYKMMDRQITNAEINDIVAANFEVTPRTIAHWWRKHGPRKA